MATPHNQAEMGDIAKVVLMPGDPLRAKFIAETFLEDVVQFNSVRNMFGYTGTYKGVKVSVMGSGMGMPSIGIYSYELFDQYGVEAIIRIGSAGSYVEDIKVYDVVLATASFSESTYARTCSGDTADMQYPSEELNNLLRASAKDLGIAIHERPVHSCDCFYQDLTEEKNNKVMSKGCVAAEMESFALFHNAKKLNKKAACLLTISDSLVTNEVTTAEERQNSFTNMMKIALETAIKL